MNVFISGGAGFIGSHLVRWLLEREEIRRIVVFDNFSSGHRSFLSESAADSRLRIVQADLKDLKALRSFRSACTMRSRLSAALSLRKERWPELKLSKTTMRLISSLSSSQRTR